MPFKGLVHIKKTLRKLALLFSDRTSSLCLDPSVPCKSSHLQNLQELLSSYCPRMTLFFSQICLQYCSLQRHFLSTFGLLGDQWFVVHFRILFLPITPWLISYQLSYFGLWVCLLVLLSMSSDLCCPLCRCF